MPKPLQSALRDLADEPGRTGREREFLEYVAAEIDKGKTMLTAIDLKPLIIPMKLLDEPDPADWWKGEPDYESDTAP